MTAASGRNGTRERNRNRPLVIARDGGICALCAHPGAKTVDHIVAAPDWPRDGYGRMLPGFDGLANLQAAHGSMGSNRTRREADNRCPTCARLCNQAKGDGRRARRVSVSSRHWL